MTSVALCPAPNYRSLTLAGAPNAGGKLYTYISGTTTNQATYTSSTAGSLNANPVIFDANGFANVWLDTTLTYTLLETDSANVTIRTQDVISNAAGATGAAGTFACSAAGGTVDAITATYSPVLTLADKTMCAIVSAGANTVTNPTFAPDGLTAHTITKLGGSALAAGDIGPALSVHILEYNLANTRWELLNPAASSTSKVVLLGTATASTSSTLNFTSLIDATIYTMYYLVFRDLLQSTTASVQVKFSTDNGANYTAAINWQKQAMQIGGSTGISFAGGTTPMLIQTSNANENNSGYAVFTTTASSGSQWESTLSDADGVLCKTYGLAIGGGVNAIQILPSAGNFTSGTVKLYGVKQT